MKQLISSAVLVLLLTTFSSSSFGQCITTFPYYEDFEGLKVLSEANSCINTTPGDTTGGWLQETTDGGEWRADSAGTPSIGTGPGATLTTSGYGSGTDYSEKSTSGKYYYIEHSTANYSTCWFDEASLISPCFDLSQASSYRFIFAYHMFGVAMGSLHIDIRDSNVWVNDVHVIRGDQGMNWKVDTVSLAGFHKSNTSVRIRYVHGFGPAGDCAIDAIKIEEFAAPDYDVEIVEMTFESTEYLSVTKKHAKDLKVTATVRNAGLKGATKTNLVAVKNWSDSTSIGNLGVATVYQDTLSSEIDHNDLTGPEVQFYLNLAENDNNPSNNVFNLRTNLSDSIYARDDSAYAGGLGWGATYTGMLGSMYELHEDDTLTTVSFLLSTPDADSVRVQLFSFTTQPDQWIATSKFVKCQNTPNWYTVSFECPQFLKKGKYFIAAEQIAVGKTVSLGFSNDRNYVANTQFYRAAGNPWTEVTQSPFIATFLIRMNFGSLENKGPKIVIQNIKDTICEGDALSLAVAGQNVIGYKWSPASAFSNPTSRLTSFTSDTTVTIRLQAWTSCNIITTIEKEVFVKKKPQGLPSPDTTICLGDQVHLRIQTNNSYTWQNGPSNQDYYSTPNGDQTYKVSVDSTNGCSRTYSINVRASSPDLQVIPDTVTCEGEEIALYASGGVSYEWNNGTKTAINRVRPMVTSLYSVTAYNALGCSRTDSVRVLVDPAPITTVSNDTAVCFGQFVTLRVQGGVSNEWQNGPKTGEWNFRPLSTKEFIALSAGQDGCIKRDTVRVVVAGNPQVSLRSDTTICEGTSINLQAMTTDEVHFAWNTGDTTKSINVSPVTQSKYRVRVMNDVGCNAADSVLIGVDPLPVAGLELTQNGEKVTLINKSMHGNNYQWDFGDGGSSNETNVVHTYTTNDNFTIRLTVTNNCGTDDTSVTVTVDNIGIPDMENRMGVKVRPNPAGEGYFLVSFEGDEYGPVEITIVDLTGKQVVELHDVKSTRFFETELDVKNLSPGLYMMKVAAGNGLTTIPVIVH